MYPFMIKNNKYRNYLIKLLKDKNYKLRIFEKEKDLKMYEYFLPKARKLLFSSFSFSNEKNKQLKELPIDTRAAILSKYPCNIFEYNLNTDIQAKIDNKNGIYFTIRKIEIICFNTGICFLCIKASLEDESTFSDVLNFNYKFKDIYSKTSELNGYDKIRLQTDSFSNVETFRELIQNIVGNNDEIKKLNINTERFLTYSYLCIDQSAWDNVNGFEKIEKFWI